MFETVFKKIDDILYKEAGCNSELDYAEQTAWMLFLKYLDELESERKDEAALAGGRYQFLLVPQHRWSSWAAPKKSDGTPDHNRALTGDDLLNYVNNELFPYLKGFKGGAAATDSIEYKIGEIFGEIQNKFQSGNSLRGALDQMDKLEMRTQKEKHELSDLYETRINKMGNAGRNGGQYYTPRPLIRAMIAVTAPKIGETVYDGACGSAGFLCEAFEKMDRDDLTTKESRTLRTRTFHGREKKSLAYIIGIMNMILHGIEVPRIVHTNTLAQSLDDIRPRDRHDVVLANPPFGGRERSEVRQNFYIQTGETAFLFLQHFIKILKPGGRAAVVIKNTFLSNSDNASGSLRKELLENCNLHTVLDCPSGTFQGSGVKTVVLFFIKGKPTRKIWFYQLDPERSLGKTNPLNDDDLAEFVKLQKTRADSQNSWSIGIKDIDPAGGYDLAVRNPNANPAPALRDPRQILAEIELLDKEAGVVLSKLRKQLGDRFHD